MISSWNCASLTVSTHFVEASNPHPFNSRRALWPRNVRCPAFQRYPITEVAETYLYQLCGSERLFISQLRRLRYVRVHAMPVSIVLAHVRARRVVGRIVYASRPRKQVSSLADVVGDGWRSLVRRLSLAPPLHSASSCYIDGDYFCFNANFRFLTSLRWIYRV